ncbi:outer membrane protein assembly factor BamA [bacterium]|nr:outer membrane protein assembly factor BamA [bacterium]
MRGAGTSRRGLKLGAGGLVLAAGLGLAGAGGLAPEGLWAQTTQPASQPPSPGDFSLGVEDNAQPAVPVAPVPPGFTFNAVKVQGNVAIDAPTIVSYLGLAKGKVVTEAQLNDAYQRIFGTGLFTRVELVPQNNTLLVKVVENPTIGTIDFQGNARIKDEDLFKLIKSKSRQVYSPAQAEDDARSITELYRVQSRMAATVTPRIIRRANNKVDLVFEITEGKVTEIARLSFVGNKAFSDYRLRQVLNSKQAGILHALIQRDSYRTDRLEMDKKLLSDFYLSRGYLDFQILDAGATYSRERDATFLTFTISEGQSFRIGKVSTVSEVAGVDAAPFEKLLRLRSGVTYSPNVIQNNVDALESLALQKGLNFITVEPRMHRNDRDGTVDVAFTIVRGQRAFVERIDIEGNTTTLDSVIRRQFHTVEGDPMNPHEIAQAAERIRALGFFSDVSVTQEPGSAPDQDVVKVAVTEEPTGSLSFGATYGVSNGFGVIIGFSEKNFLGRGQGLTVDIQTGVANVDSKIQFSEPAFLGRDLLFGFTAELATTTKQQNYFDTKVLTLSPSIGFRVSDFGRLSLNYALKRQQLLNVDPSSSAVLQGEVGTTISSAVGYDYTWDDRQSGLHPRGGVMFQFGQSVAGLGGDVKFVNTTASALAETKVLHDDVTLRISVEGGAISGYGGYNTNVNDRYFRAGTMRGFQSSGIGPRDLSVSNKDALGGNFYAVAHLESEFPLGLPEEYGLKGGAFLDVGSVWGLSSGEKGMLDAASQATTTANLRSVIGLSLFWKTPLGPLRFDFTHALKKETYDKEQNFNFTISTKF